jgi:hypothetical protein
MMTMMFNPTSACLALLLFLISTPTVQAQNQTPGAMRFSYQAPVEKIHSWYTSSNSKQDASNTQSLDDNPNGLPTVELTPAFAKLPSLEVRLLGHSYPTQEVPKRLTRLERLLFGSTQTGSLESRMAQISQRVRENHERRAQSNHEPVLGYLENRIFQHSFENLPLPDRLHQLEIKVFGISFDNYPNEIRLKKLTYGIPLNGADIRLSHTGQDDQIAATHNRKRNTEAPSDKNTVELFSAAPAKLIPATIANKAPTPNKVVTLKKEVIQLNEIIPLQLSSPPAISQLANVPLQISQTDPEPWSIPSPSGPKATKDIGIPPQAAPSPSFPPNQSSTPYTPTPLPAIIDTNIGISRINERASDTRREQHRSVSVDGTTCASEQHSNKVDDCQTINYGNDSTYFSNLAQVPGGKILRWVSMPIRVFNKGGVGEEKNLAAALNSWRPDVEWLIVPDQKDSDIIVSWDEADWLQNTHGFLVRPVTQITNQHSIHTILMLTFFPLIEQSTAQRQHTMIHVLGHALGLWGHSTESQDVMYPLYSQETNDFPTDWAGLQSKPAGSSQPTEALPTSLSTSIFDSGSNQLSNRDHATFKAVYQNPASDIHAQPLFLKQNFTPESQTPTVP